jgi:hypothetical protein
MSKPFATQPPQAVSLSADAVVEDVAPDVEEIGPPPRGHRNAIIRLISVVVVLLAWVVFGRQIEPLFMSYPTAISTSAFEMIRSGELPAAFLDSLGTLLLGFLVASVLGIAIGLLIGRYRTVEAATDWLVNALYATPLVAIIPLVVLWFGLGFSAKLFIDTLPVDFRSLYEQEQRYVERIRGASIYPAIENIILACRALGLGTTITTNHIRCEDEAKEVLGIPANVQTFAMMPVGYPYGKYGPVVRRPVAEVSYADRWSQPWPGANNTQNA